jgi:serine/threonine protein kinase
LEYGNYSFKSDVWAFGIVLWELFSFGKMPYAGMSNAKAATKVLNGYKMPCPENCPQEIYGLMEICWAIDPNDRPSIQVIQSMDP